ncbi:tetratricopeptide repeat protein [Polynucleobacter sp. MWH-Jannik1A5]|uniref:tetratricopeptide repeat protein n=1 Tax=Polynucleobacter sp. MWH-Jannik1A5 TaxID=1855890 RepID=UPI001C0CDB75|nr:tetratricopeptide repeat protein [Polynucleobacter sp. MWH-Jannik1A5]MBU3546514.1 tetratricopeptide repeat protein [Polynucleobacter sp. MWH-Jannik1A5]
MNDPSRHIQLIQNWLKQGEIESAKALLSEMIAETPNNQEVIEYLALIYEHEGDDESAMKLLLDAMSILSCSPSLKFNLADLYLKHGAHQKAIQLYKSVLETTPSFFEVLHNLGLAHAQLFQFNEAAQYFEQASLINPNSFELQANWGAALKNLGKYQKSLDCLDLAIANNPLDPSVWLNKGVTLDAMDRQQQAVDCYEKAIKLDHRYHEAHCNVANTLIVLGKYDQAMSAFQKALAIKANDPDTLYNLSLLQLIQGDFINGWANYEYRWLRENAPKKLFSEIPPLLDINGVSGKDILVWSEQGLGDSIQFSRYVIPLKNLGAKITLATQPQLIGLLQSMRAIENITSIDQIQKNNFDAQIPLLSLPLLFQQSNIKPQIQIPYLRSNPDKKLMWANRLCNIKGLKVGLVWNGGFRPEKTESWYERRNIQLSDIAMLNDVPGVHFFNLQKGEPAESELLEYYSTLWPKNNLSIFTSELNTFEDTAALVENLDLVISVDTSTAHLAGALGKPVWILNRFDTCWRWLIQQEKTHWYPSAKIFNQPLPGDWQSVIAKVKSELADLAALNRTAI